jgi:hypothetical protein
MNSVKKRILESIGFVVVTEEEFSQAANAAEEFAGRQSRAISEPGFSGQSATVPSAFHTELLCEPAAILAQPSAMYSNVASDLQGMTSSASPSSPPQ